MNREHTMDDVVPITAGGAHYLIALPNRDSDHIQSLIARTGKPYEEEMLAAIASLISEGDLVLDIGSNIGNHALYLAAVAKASIVAFEPNSELAGAISRSAMLNGFDGMISVCASAVGSRAAKGVLRLQDASNLGSAEVEVSSEGDFEVVTLDSVELGAPVAVIKVDVEGMELDVIAGARELISRDRPLLFIEARTAEEFAAILGAMRRLDYQLANTYNYTPTHLFRPTERVEFDAHSDAALVDATMQRYRAEAARDAARRERDLASGAASRLEVQRQELVVAAEERDKLTDHIASLTRERDGYAKETERLVLTIANLRAENEEAIASEKRELIAVLDSVRKERDALARQLHSLNSSTGVRWVKRGWAAADLLVSLWSRVRGGKRSARQ